MILVQMQDLKRLTVHGTIIDVATVSVITSEMKVRPRPWNTGRAQGRAPGNPRAGHRGVNVGISKRVSNPVVQFTSLDTDTPERAEIDPRSRAQRQ